MLTPQKVVPNLTRCQLGARTRPDSRARRDAARPSGSAGQRGVAQPDRALARLRRVGARWADGADGSGAGRPAAAGRALPARRLALRGAGRPPGRRRPGPRWPGWWARGAWPCCSGATSRCRPAGPDWMVARGSRCWAPRWRPPRSRGDGARARRRRRGARSGRPAPSPGPSRPAPSRSVATSASAGTAGWWPWPASGCASTARWRVARCAPMPTIGAEGLARRLVRDVVAGAIVAEATSPSCTWRPPTPGPGGCTSTSVSGSGGEVQWMVLQAPAPGRGGLNGGVVGPETGPGHAVGPDLGTLVDNERVNEALSS